LTKPSLMLLASLLNLGVVSCKGKPIVVPNSEACIEVTRERAKCFWSIQGPERTIEPSQWRRERIGRVSLTPSTFGAYKKLIEKVCLRTKCVINGGDGLALMERISDEYDNVLENIEAN